MTTRSEHVDFFNHDPWADGYDLNVTITTDPIRAGYEETLNWTVEIAQATPESVVVDLGSGTGNTSARLPSVRRLICVDISERMTDVARAKLANQPDVEFVLTDFLAFFHNGAPDFDLLVSTYAVHHLTEDEKTLLFEHLWRSLAPGGRAVFGDLMFASAAAEAKMSEWYAEQGEDDLVADFEEEFFWHVDLATDKFKRIGYRVVDVRRFSELSWGICVEKPTPEFWSKGA